MVSGSITGLFPLESLEEVDYYFTYFWEVYFQDSWGSVSCETCF